ncbi:hypothetical protein HK27_06020 [Acetobacter orientalis]|nr:hypothetical protein HK27_06020 [Acetobacter orientalis]
MLSLKGIKKRPRTKCPGVAQFYPNTPAKRLFLKCRIAGWPGVWGTKEPTRGRPFGGELGC